MKLLDQGTLKSVVVNSEDVLNLTAGRSYSAGGHNLHFSTRILKHVRILTPDTNSEARANSDIWHEFWSTCEFWHLTRILKHARILTPIIFSLSLLRPLPKSGPLYFKEMKWIQKGVLWYVHVFVINWMNKLLRHEQEQEQALLHNIIEVEVINFIFKFSILTLLDDQ